MEDFVIHMHLYLTDKENEFTAYQNLKRLKQYGLKVLVTSPKPLPEYLYEFVDYFCHDKENQLLTREYENIEPTVLWTRINNMQLRFVVTKLQKHGLAVLRAMIKGCQLASAYGFKHIIRFEYDDLFGPQSVKLMEDTAKKIIEEKYDFWVHKNVYEGRRNDISVHIMYYNCNKFLEVFGGVRDEETYNEHLVRLGEARQSLILEQFLLLNLEKTNVNIKVKYEPDAIDIYKDTIFNKHQSDPGIRDGVLSDVMPIYVNGDMLYNQVYLAAQNFSSENTQMVYYDVFDMNDNLVHTYFFRLEKNHWQYLEISLDNIKVIKMKHNNSDYHKVIEVDPHTRQITTFEDNVKQEVFSQAFITQ